MCKYRFDTTQNYIILKTTFSMNVSYNNFNKYAMNKNQKNFAELLQIESLIIQLKSTKKTYFRGYEDKRVIFTTTACIFPKKLSCLILMRLIQKYMKVHYLYMYNNLCADSSGQMLLSVFYLENI